MLQRFGMADAISTAIAEARAKRGMTASEVARAMNTTPQAVYNWEKGKNRPASKNLLALAEVLRVDGQRFLAGEVVLLGEGPEAPQLPNSAPLARSPREVELDNDAPDFGAIGGPRDVPEYGIAVGGEEGDFTLNGETVGYVTRPLSLKGRSVFAVRVKGSSMSPRFDEGDVLYVERHREPSIGDDGIFEMKPTDEWQAGHAFVKQLVAKGMGVVKVKQFNPLDEFTFRRDQIVRMFRVVPRNELLSV
jgi:phage repressor protein C with HTH and peptisase S24 domain